IPMIISTSWMKLREFFLTDKHNNTLKELGLEIKYKEDIPVFTTAKDTPTVTESILEKKKAKIRGENQ
ncbi:MAG: hypothetical protein ACXABJ_05285, partial [Candidatus Heimdallarchaeaceae archaeon]